MLRTFFKALFSNWLSAMSGPLSVPFAVAALYVPSDWVPGDLAKVLLLGASYVCVWGAAFGIWKIEHDKATSGSVEIERLKRVAPELVGEVDGFVFGGRSDQIQGASPFIVVASISNVGTMQSSAKDFELSLLRNGEVKSLQVLAIPNYINLGFGEGDRSKQQFIRYDADQSLYKKAATPITTGSFVQGLLMAMLPDTEKEWISPGTVIVLSFKDIKGNKYQVTKDFTGARAPLQDFSGLKGSINDGSES